MRQRWLGLSMFSCCARKLLCKKCSNEFVGPWSTPGAKKCLFLIWGMWRILLTDRIMLFCYTNCNLRTSALEWEGGHIRIYRPIFRVLSASKRLSVSTRISWLSSYLSSSIISSLRSVHIQLFHGLIACTAPVCEDGSISGSFFGQIAYSQRIFFFVLLLLLRLLFYPCTMDVFCPK